MQFFYKILFTCLISTHVMADDFCVYIHNQSSGENIVYNEERCNTRFTAHSTFKIPNTLIAIESGAVELSEVFEFDPERHTHPMRPGAAYNRNQTLETAFKNSVVWTYQEIAKRVGSEKYISFLDNFKYGNQDQSSGLTNFWLESLKISPKEQVEFLKSLNQGELQLQAETIQSAKKIFLTKETEVYKIYSKTGTSAPKNGIWSGWLVGFIESKNNTTYFAIHTDAKTYKSLKEKREELLQNILNNMKPSQVHSS